MTNLVKEERILKITKSWKYEGYCMVTSFKGKDYKRKVYPRTYGKFAGRYLVYFEDEAYSFIWGESNEIAVDIRWAYSVVKDQDPEITEAIAEIAPEIKVEEVKVVANGEVFHEKFEEIKVCIENNIPVYLVGPAGSGKNHTLEQIAWDLNLDFYFTNSVQQEFKLTGFIDAGGIYHETEFFRAFTKGGLFFLDEMDASIPEVLVLLNAAIANGYFEFPTGKVEVHENFRVVAAGNTVGDGATEQYTGRLTLDQATLDRFYIIEFDYSEKIELAISKGNIDLVTFVREMRTQATEKGIRATFSYRCITMVTKLEGKMELANVIKNAIFKGMDQDTINTFRTNYKASRYFMALEKIQKGQK